MTTDVYSLHCSPLSQAKLVAFRGTEYLGKPFEFDIFFTVPTGTEVKSAVNAKATLIMDRKSAAEPMAWHGVLARIRLLHESSERTLYQAVLVPKLWMLRYSVRSFVHVKKKIDVFSSDTLKDGGLTTQDFKFNANSGKYPEEEFVCQYRESHLDFVHRWFQREGIYYYFEHPSGEDDTELMQIVDDKGQHNPLMGSGRVRYYPSGLGDLSAGECLRELHVDFSSMPASVIIADYNYSNPQAPVSGEHAVSSVGLGQLHEYAYRVFTQAEADRLAEIKSQSIVCRELTLQAVGNAMGLRAGYVFEIEDGPSDLPTRWLAIEVQHAGALSVTTENVSRYTGLDTKETYRVTVTAIPADVQFRAPHETPWPRVYGYENGTVDGAGDSQYAQIDDMGRYLVRFKFDTANLDDGSTSTYLRMMQPHGGSIEGFHFPLRKGTEVMVAFQGGDPDRPVIAGVVPNAHRPSVVTNRNYTFNVLRTGGNNHMVIEDLEGKQHIDLYCPTAETNVHMGGPARHAFIVPPSTPDDPPTFRAVDCTFYMYTENTAGFNVGGEWWQNVGDNYWLDVTGNATIHYVGVHTLNIDSDSNEFYNSHRNTTIAAGRTDTVKAGGMKQDITGGLTQTVKPGGKQEVTGGWLHKVTSTNTDDYGTWVSTIGRGGWTATIAGTTGIDSTGAITIHSPQTITIQSDAEVKVKSPKWWKTTPYFWEWFGTKDSAGIHKWDNTAINMAINIAKTEATALSTSRVGMKADSAGIKVDHVAIASKKCGAGQNVSAFTTKQAAASIGTFGFKKL